MSKNRKESFFWTSYSDLMTSLFFVMLVLFILVIVLLHNKMIDIANRNDEITKLNNEAQSQLYTITNLQKVTQAQLDTITNLQKVTQEQIDKIKEIQKATENINTNYFQYDKTFKRHTLKDIKVSFSKNSANINDISAHDLEKLKKAGKSIVDFMSKPEIVQSEASYMLILEGQSSKDNYSLNNELSYRRALSLYNFWIDNNIRVDQLDNCEVIISGSGQSSKFRIEPDNANNEDNQRFVIHIIPKPGIIE